MSTLLRIKALVEANRVEFTEKADLEMARDNIDEDMVHEAILSAKGILKTIRSTNPHSSQREHLYIIVGESREGILIYTKGRFEISNGEEKYYVLISSKRFID